MHILVFAFLLVSFSVGAEEKVAPLRGDVVIKRVKSALWQVQYCFEEPVEIFGFERPIKKMREAHWRSVVANHQLHYTAEDTAYVQVEDESAFSCTTVEMTPYTELPHGKDYYSYTSFSDGGMSLYTGHLEGSVRQHGVWREVKWRAEYQPLEGERIVAGKPQELGHQFVYFGAQDFIETDEATMIVDPAMPEAVRLAIESAMIKTNEILPQVFSYQPPHKYLVFMAAGDLDKNNGTSIKGGTGPHQIRFTLVGRGTIRLAESEPLFYPKLAVHEVVHLWQSDVWFQQLSGPHQWVHEGAADAITYEIMRLAGIYGATEYANTWQEVENKCVTLLAQTSVHGGVEAGHNDVLYQCGAFANYLVGAALDSTDPGAGIMTFWKAMASWDKSTILTLGNEELFFKTMAKVGISEMQQAALRHFLADKLGDPAADVAKIKQAFGLQP